MSFGRSAVVEVGPVGGNGRRIEGARFAFVARFNGGEKPNEGKITAWNLSDATAGLFAKGSLVRILAGYDDEGGPVQVFEGTPVRGGVHDEHTGTERITSADLADGGAALRDTRIGLSLAGPIKASDVLEELRVKLGLAKGVVEIGEDVTLARGWAHVGPARRALREIAKTTRSIVSVIDGRLTVYPLRGERKVFGHEIATETGLVSAKLTSEGVEVRCLLLPSLRPGDVFRLRSRRIEGDFVAKTVEHSGDTHEGDFETVIVGRKR